MKNIEKKYSYLVTLLLILGLSMQAFAQEETKSTLLVKVNYLLVNNKVPYVMVKIKSKVNKKLQTVKGLEVKLFLDNDSANNLIGTVITNYFGEGVLPFTPSVKNTWSLSETHKIIAVTADNKQYEASNSDITISKARLYIDTMDDKNVKLVVKELKGTEEVPVKGVEVKIGVKRLGSEIGVNEETTLTTDSLGQVTTEFKRIGIPGDTIGNIILVGKVEDNEKYGNLNNGLKRYYRVDEVACYFSVSDRTIYRLIDTGDFKVIRIRGCVRIPVEEINCLEEKLKEESF